jgi:hypothetical protein
MHKYVGNRTEHLISQESASNPWRRTLDAWNKARHHRKAADVVAGLDARLQYDIGHSDLRPAPPRFSQSQLNAYALSVDAMLKRSI